jgi:hypothetical protein
MAELRIIKPLLNQTIPYIPTSVQSAPSKVKSLYDNRNDFVELRIEKPPLHPITPYIPTIVQPAARQAKSLYDSNDVYLAFSNLAVLGLQTALKNTYNTPLYIAYIIGANIQNYFSFEQIPDSAAITKAALPLIQLGGIWFPSLRLIGAAGQFLGVAKSTLPKLFTCAKNGFNKPLEAITGAALHAFNLGSQGYIAHDIVTEAYQELTTIPKCPAKAKADFAKMKPTDRFAKPDLDPTCSQHAEILMGLDDNSTCSAIKSAFRKMSLHAHPDKGGSAKALENLVTARDTLNTLNSCKA